MATITLTEGDFGAGVRVTVDSAALYVPDAARPGAMMMVPLAEIAEIESLKDDNSERLKAGLKLSGRGFMAAGPIGLAAGLLAAGRVKNIIFEVRLKDGRRFTATADAGVYSDLHAAQLAARAEADAERGYPDPLIEKYLNPGPAIAPDPTPEATPSPAVAAEPPPAASVPPASPRGAPARPVFGRRGR